MRGFKSYDFGNLLRRKYDIQQQEADARTVGAQRQFVAGPGTGMPDPGRVMSLGGAGLGMGGVGGVAEDPNADLQRSLLETQIGAAKAETGFNRRRTAAIGNSELAADQLAAETKRQTNFGFNSGQFTPEQIRAQQERDMDDATLWEQIMGQTKKDLGFKKGVAVVRAKGQGMRAALNASGKKDTVKAKLAPGEAVLNKSAADMLGRGMIAKLNAKGAAKMGMI